MMSSESLGVAALFETGCETLLLVSILTTAGWTRLAISAKDLGWANAAHAMPNITIKIAAKRNLLRLEAVRFMNIAVSPQNRDVAVLILRNYNKSKYLFIRCQKLSTKQYF